MTDASTPSRYIADDDNRIYDKEQICFYIREKDAIQKMNNKLEDVARMVEKSTEPRAALADRVRAKKERV
jgi:hypothetical protein